jgi:hypothetical protein
MYYRRQILHGTDVFIYFFPEQTRFFLDLIQFPEVLILLCLDVEEFPRNVHGGKNGDFEFFPGRYTGLYFFHFTVDEFCHLFCRFNIDITLD